MCDPGNDAVIILRGYMRKNLILLALFVLTVSFLTAWDGTDASENSHESRSRRYLESLSAELPEVVPESKGKTKGHAVCSHCGGEADIWLDV